MSTVTSLAFNYADTADPDLPLYGAVVAGRAGVKKDFYRALRGTGTRRIQYVNWVDVGARFGPFDEMFEPAGSDVLPVSNWPGFQVVSFTAAQKDRIVEGAKRALADPDLDDFFCDVAGERLWSSAWTSMTAAQRTDWPKHMDEVVQRIADERDLNRPGAYLFLNGSWANGHKRGRGVVEHHPLSELAFWRGNLDPSKWDPAGTPGGIIIATTVAEATTWAATPGVGMVAAQATYASAPSAAIARTVFPDRAAGPTPPAPPPSSGPSQAQLDAALAQLAQVRSAVAAETQRHVTAIAQALA